jgi:xanthine dehydrogenase YagS FAD-binding subunit
VVPFAYAAAPSAEAAIAHVARRRGAEFIAGGTDMLQLLQEGVRAPAELVDINRLPLAGIEVDSDGVRIGATARMSASPIIRGSARSTRRWRRRCC